MAPINGLSDSSDLSLQLRSNENNNSKITHALDKEEKYGHFKKLEILRLITQCLDDLNYKEFSSQLKQIEGNSNDNNVEIFMNYIKIGNFKEAEVLVESLNLIHLSNPGDIIIDIHEEEKNPNIYSYLKLKYLIRKQIFLELLLGSNDHSTAISFLRSAFQDLRLHPDEIRILSSLMLLNEKDILKLNKIGWYDSVENSRIKLCEEISKMISPDTLLPSNRLLTLLEQSINYQKSQNLYYLRDKQKGEETYPLYQDLKFDKSNFPTRCIAQLNYHNDEVWFVKFSYSGRYLCSTSKDSKVIIYDVMNDFSIKHELLGSTKSVLYASWSPDDKVLLTCGMDLYFRLWDVESGQQLKKIKFYETVRVWSCEWLPDSSGFITASPDKKLVWFEFNSKTNDCKELYNWDLSQRIEDLSITKDGTKLLTITYNQMLEIYDLNTKLKIQSINIGKKLTSITTSQDSKYCIINVSPEEIQLWDIIEFKLISRFFGQQQQNYVIRSCFGNWDESFILSGSEDGRIYIWNRHFCNLIFALDGHKGLVNGVDWNKNGEGYYGKIFASAGDDKTVRIWGV
ncbi:hypothetical protein PACTADRAFT_47667 [Pachysolen tannophilus NRRL Y-2460]|uniref:Uncharacterized protein n=1 Tax=Pachysolen tannophilus NRRL Y-2460 TaxID=669874 RepID=A0A1E4U1D2_PACTA|nr:hypothetical protein PACTADRAFT_47667 [Pachysolen tannophilus NRRL Y-2460]